MKTAVEFYREELNALISLRESNFKTEQEIFEQAKEMDKENMVDFARKCLEKAKDLDVLTAFLNTEKYYNETFKKQETETYPCPQCQGGGCPYCCGYGTIPK